MAVPEHVVVSNTQNVKTRHVQYVEGAGPPLDFAATKYFGFKKRDGNISFFWLIFLFVGFM